MPPVLEVTDKFTGERIAELPFAGGAEVDAAVRRAATAFPEWSATPAHRRSAIIARAAALIDERVDAFTESIAREAGKAWKHSANEVARSAMLLPGFLAIARETGLPLEIAEIGASAGLNLNFDRCHYRYGTAVWGDPASPVRLAPELRGELPPLDGALTVAARSGCDIAPVDLSNKAARLRLRCFIWADQTARLQRLDAAIGLALAAPVTLVQADAADFVRQKLAARSEGVVLVVFHSAMWDYMPHPTRDATKTAIRDAATVATQRSPLASRSRSRAHGEHPSRLSADRVDGAGWIGVSGQPTRRRPLPARPPVRR